MRKVAVEFERDLCCHAVGQCLDEIAQQILFFREQIPNLVANILHETADTNQHDDSLNSNSRQTMLSASRAKKRREFVDAFDEIRRSLRRLFNGRNEKKIARAMLLLGDSPAYPKDAYFVNFEICAKNDAQDGDSEEFEFCRNLNEKEFARLARTLVASDQCPFTNMKKISVCKMFVLVHGTRDLDLKETTFVPRADLNMDRIASTKPNTNVVSVDLYKRPRKNAGTVDQLAERVQRVNLNDENNTRLESEYDSQLLWFMCKNPICGLSA